MTQHTKRVLFSAMAVIVLLTACFPQQQQATQDPAEAANQVATSVALTVSAMSAQTEAAKPVPTNTTLPTQTESALPSPTFTLTATPFVIVPPTVTAVSSGGGGGGGGGVAVTPAFDCTPINNRPRDNTVFHKNAEFDIKWTIVNTGTKIIPANLDIKYFSGPKMMKVPTDTFREFGVDLKPGESITIIIDAIAPAEKGFHVMTWRVEGIPAPCAPYVAIIVE